MPAGTLPFESSRNTGLLAEGEQRAELAVHLPQALAQDAAQIAHEDHAEPGVGFHEFEQGLAWDYDDLRLANADDVRRARATVDEGDFAEHLAWNDIGEWVADMGDDLRLAREEDHEVAIHGAMLDDALGVGVRARLGNGLETLDILRLHSFRQVGERHGEPVLGKGAHRNLFSQCTAVSWPRGSDSRQRRQSPERSLQGMSNRLRSRWIVLGVLAAGSGALAIAAFNRDDGVRSVSAVVDGTLVTLRSPVAGVLRLEAREISESVEAGAVLASVVPTPDDPITAPAPLEGLGGGFSRPIPVRDRGDATERNGWERRLEEARRQLASLPVVPALPTPEPKSKPDLSQHRRAVASAEEELRAAQAIEAEARRAADRARHLYEEGAISRNQAEAASAKANQAADEVNAAQSGLERTRQALAEAEQDARAVRETNPAQANPDPRRAALVAEIAALEASLAEAKRTPKTTIRLAPPRAISGSIGTAPLRPLVPEEITNPETKSLQVPSSGLIWALRAKDDSAVEPNQPIATILLTDTIWVQANFRPAAARKIAVGDRARVRLAERVLDAKVESIGVDPHWSTASQTRHLDSGLVPVRLSLAWPKDVQPERLVGTPASVEIEKG